MLDSDADVRTEFGELRSMEAVVGRMRRSGAGEKKSRREWERRGVRDERNDDLLDGYLYVWRTSATFAFYSPTSHHFTQLSCIVDP